MVDAWNGRRGTLATQVEDHLERLSEAGQTCITRTMLEHRAGLGEVHLLDEDLGRWLDRIKGPETEQLASARRELALAEYAAASGLYRQAFSSLRLFLELSFAAVHFSVNEFERRQWVSDRSDFSWSSALDADTGVLSKSFVVEFLPEARDVARDWATAAAASYRHCSQFVHGKAVVARTLPIGIEYKSEIVADWCARAKQAGEAVLFLLMVRYSVALRAAADDDLSEILTNRFGHLAPVRTLLDLAGDQ